MNSRKKRAYQLTIRLEGEIAERVRETAKEESISLNRAVVKLLQRGAGMDRRPGAAIGHRLDRFIGAISPEERKKIDSEVEEAFGKPDPELWR